MVAVVLKVPSIHSHDCSTILLTIGRHDLSDLWTGVVLEGGVEVLVGQLVVVEVACD